MKVTLHADVPWDQVVSNPLSLKRAVLKDACRSIGEPVSGTKAVLVLRLLQYFKIERPCEVPALVLLAVKHEKVSYVTTQQNQSLDLRFAVSLAFKQITETDINADPVGTSMFAVRKVLASNFASIIDLLQWASIHRPKHVVSKKRKGKKARGKCVCGNIAAVACSQACCKRCCQGPCHCHRC